jgi:hypothetical protein
VTAALIMFAVSLLVGTFLRSNVINNNDLGWRSVLFAQFIVLIWSVDPLRAWWRSRPRRAGIYALLALGLASASLLLFQASSPVSLQASIATGRQIRRPKSAEISPGAPVHQMSLRVGSTWINAAESIRRLAARVVRRDKPAWSSE